jgi:hypothetical protein
MRSLKYFISENLKKWPNSISLDNSRIIEETGGYYSPLLSETWDRLENNSTETFEEIAHWTIFGLYHKEMKKLKLLNSSEPAQKDAFELEEIIKTFIKNIRESEDETLEKKLFEFEEIAKGVIRLNNLKNE